MENGVDINIPIPDNLKGTLEWLIKIGEHSQARTLALTTARYLSPEAPETTDFLAMILHRCRYYREAVEYARQTVHLLPNRLEARYNLARCLNSLGEASLAEEQIHSVITARPDWLDPQLDLAMYIGAQ